MDSVIGPLRTHPCIRRHPANPILTAADVPFDCSLVFNAGVARVGGRYVMVFRNDYGQRADSPHPARTNLGLAFSEDGVTWAVESRPCWEPDDDEVRRAYDPRLTMIDDQCYMCFAQDTAHGVRGGIARTEDFERFDILHLTVPDNRNMVLFPERVSERYVRLERPFPVYGRGGGERFDIWLSASPDLRYWGDSRLVLGVEDVPFANGKLGPAAPPIRTEAGWLTLFHATDVDPSRGKNGWEDCWQKRYSAGVMLLDLDDPARVIGMCPDPLIAPEADYEVDGGFRNNVVFPTGMILEPDGEVRIYYGAADTVMCLASASVNDLIAACTGR